MCVILLLHPDLLCRLHACMITRTHTRARAHVRAHVLGRHLHRHHKYNNSTHLARRASSCTVALFSQHRPQPSHTTRSSLTHPPPLPPPPPLLSGSHAGYSCTSTKTTSNDWATVGCGVETPSGNCVGFGCEAEGLVSIGAITSIEEGYMCDIQSCTSAGGDFVVISQGTLEYYVGMRWQCILLF